jgi:four helix bundle protein
VSEKKALYGSPGEKGKRGFEDLECYQLALEVMAEIYAFSKTLRADERYDLYAQVRRSSKGVTGNIAEAYRRYHYLDSLHYYSIARGEWNETLGHSINAHVLKYINQPDFESPYKLIHETERALNGFMSYLRRQRAGGQEFGNKRVGENPTDYDVTLFEEESD